MPRFTDAVAIATLTGALMIPVAGFFTIPAAHADSLSAKESSFVTEYGASVICPAVAKFCPSNFPLLQETGAYFRAQNKGQRV